MAKYFCFLFLITAYSFHAQTNTRTTWYDPEKKREEYRYYIQNGDTIKEGKYTIYHPNGKAWQSGNFRNNQLDSIWTDHYPEGGIKQELPYSNGKLNGISRIYYPEGGLYQSITYKNDLPNGKLTVYYEDGATMEISYYINGKINGESLAYYNSGSIWYKRNFNDGVEIGLGYYYYDNGNIMEMSRKYNGLPDSLYILYYKDNANVIKNKCYYKQGKLNGPFMGYYPDGSLMNTSLYVNDSVVGTYTEYYPQKQDISPIKPMILEEGKYKNGKKDGIWNTYYKDGSLYVTGRYEHGKKEGEWKVFFENGATKQTSFYTNNIEDGEFVQYHPDGKTIKMKGKIIQGRREGKFYSYFPEGKINSEVEYKEGRRTGIARMYDQNGGVIKERNYDIEPEIENTEEANEN